MIYYTTQIPTYLFLKDCKFSFKEITQSEYFEMLADAQPLPKYISESCNILIAHFEPLPKESTFISQFFLVDYRIKPTPIKVPASALVNQFTQKVELEYKNTNAEKLGYRAKNYVRDLAKKHPNYKIPVECDAVGMAHNGKEIKIDTLGKWLFGVPNFQGHIIVEAKDEKLVCYVPDNCPKQVLDMLKQLEV